MQKHTKEWKGKTTKLFLRNKRFICRECCHIVAVVAFVVAFDFEVAVAVVVVVIVVVVTVVVLLVVAVQPPNSKFVDICQLNNVINFSVLDCACRKS